MNKLSNTKCEVCLRKGVQTKVRTICNECREFLCKECSDTHLLHKSSQNHSLIDLDPPGEEPRSACEDELASHFLKQATVSETTVLYRAQVAVEIKLHGETEIAKVKLTKCHEFLVKRPDDTRNVCVTGVLNIDDKIIIEDYFMRKLKLFDRSGKYLSSTDMENHPWGITRVDKDKFATCGFDQKVFIWILSGETIKENETYDVEHGAEGIHYSNTYYCVLHRYDNAITILDTQGRQVRKIVMKEAFGKKIKFGWDIHMDNETNNIYVPCVYDNNGVLCMSVEGEALWFTPISDVDLRGIIEIHGTLCIADIRNDKRCLHLVSKTGQYIRKLLQKEELVGDPSCIHYNDKENKLYISYTKSTKPDIISVYSLQ